MICAIHVYSPAQSSNRYFAQQSMDLLHILWIIRTVPRSVLCATDWKPVSRVQADEVLFYFEVTVYT